jgi:hypothetical protein
MNLIEELEHQKNQITSRQIRGRFITQLSMLVEGFDKQYSISQILHTLLRKEGEKKGEKETPYVWSDDKMLKKAEELYKKMVKEAQQFDDYER